MPQGNLAKPSILGIWGDDVGISNLCGYSHAVMGCRTPSIDRLAAQKPRTFTVDALEKISAAAGRS